MTKKKNTLVSSWIVEDLANSTCYLFGPYKVKTPEEALAKYFKDEMIQEEHQPDKYTVYPLGAPTRLEVVEPPCKLIIKRI